jgi:single-strand DNA-binding protein
MYAVIIIVGNLGRDPEMRYTPAGQAVTNFSVATNRKYTGSDGQLVSETTWWRISTWGKNAENCSQYLHRGSKVLVEGRIVPDPKTGGPRIYTRKDGTTGAAFEINAQTVRFLSSRGDDESSEAPTDSEAEVPGATSTDDIPF